MAKSRIAKEKKTIAFMINIYCRSKEKNKELCPSCKELIEYAHKRLDNCPFGEEKSSCKRCPVHCYKPEMRQKVRDIMRYVGPRMLFLAPISYIRHLIK